MLNAARSQCQRRDEIHRRGSGDDGLFANFDVDTAMFLTARSTKAKYAMGDELIPQGEGTRRIGIIAEGIVKVCTLTEDGDEFVLQLLAQDQIVGGLDGSDSDFSWEAATDVEMCWLPQTTLDVLLREKPANYKAFLAMTSSQLSDMRRWSAAMRGRNTLQRIAYWLLRQVDGQGDERQTVIRIALSRRDLASFLDMTSETLCRGLSQLAARGVIDLRAADVVELSDLPNLRFLARCPDPRIGHNISATDPAVRGRIDFGLSGNARTSAHDGTPTDDRRQAAKFPSSRLPRLSTDNASPEFS